MKLHRGLNIELKTLPLSENLGTASSRGAPLGVASRRCYTPEFCRFERARLDFNRGEVLQAPSDKSGKRENSTVVKLRVRAGESIQEAVRRFRKLCERSGLRKEMRRKAYYEKPSERRRREELKRLRKARQHQTSRV
jgi:small subunit ribosomal protein S21